MATQRGALSQDDANAKTPFDLYLSACVEDKVDAVRSFIKENPEWVNAPSEKGETCLHVAGIYGAPGVTELLLRDHQANPNVRSTFEQGLRMHPLSWNVYAGHIDTAKVLLQYGADVNSDVDKMDYSGAKQTVLDIVDAILAMYEEQDTDPRHESYRQMKELLLQHGAKYFADIQPAED